MSSTVSQMRDTCFFFFLTAKSISQPKHLNTAFLYKVKFITGGTLAPFVNKNAIYVATKPLAPTQRRTCG